MPIPKASFWPQAGFRRRRGDAAVSLSIGASIKSKQPAATVEDFGNDRALFLASRHQSHRGLLPQAPDGVFGPVEGDTLHFTECHLSCSNTSRLLPPRARSVVVVRSFMMLLPPLLFLLYVLFYIARCVMPLRCEVPGFYVAMYTPPLCCISGSRTLTSRALDPLIRIPPSLRMLFALRKPSGRHSCPRAIAQPGDSNYCQSCDVRGKD